ncbi:uncharacterized protein BDR25DRAFT_57167 [Lindgomyces ingoldianus]|uniref:Uncharacterized protein n=1 Tax=Lindgomyces ingoldianus TaxID=673940 RepID=A0ACB6QPH1_9PLEO|nr:uncharacterized protein BDR25DRAFT_57167 [Lindgomyces ingoldianus]KAF2468051.1 hypothetical protein BDR25DRAFT_57167 [Lindgomyces ingoldianus]
MSILEPESGIWYALCWLVVLTRLASRRLHLGSWKSLQLDDYLIVLAMATDTILMAIMHIIIHTSSNLIAPGEDVSHFSSQDISERIYGSKLVLVSEQMQILTVWLVKTCLLIMYNRMTVLLPQHKLVKAVAVYVALGFVVMEILYFGVWCRPFSQYFAVPPRSSQCSAATNHLITNAVFNISSDLMIIAIPMPLLFKVKLPKKNKTILFGVFLIGTFTIIAAVLNKYYSFTHPFGTQWTIWYLRESYTAILCANLPLTWPVLQRIFNLNNWSHNSYGTGQYGTHSRPHGTISAFKSNAPKTRLQSESNSKSGSMRRGESQERINYTGEPLKIYQNMEVTIHSTSAKEIPGLELGDLGSHNSRISIDTKHSGSSGSEKARVTTTCHAV